MNRAVAVVSLALAISISTHSTATALPISCMENPFCRIDVTRDQLNHTGEAFYFIGKEVTPRHSQWNNYSKAIELFPSASSCLRSKFSDDPSVQVLDLDWKQFSVGSDLDVCLFRILSSLNSNDDIKKWLELHEFSVNEIRSYPTESYKRQQGTWSQEQYRNIWPSTFWSILGIDIVNQFDVYLGFSEEGQLVSTSAIASTK